MLSLLLASPLLLSYSSVWPLLGHSSGEEVPDTDTEEPGSAGLITAVVLPPLTWSGTEPEPVRYCGELLYLRLCPRLRRGHTTRLRGGHHPQHRSQLLIHRALKTLDRQIRGSSHNMSLRVTCRSERWLQAEAPLSPMLLLEDAGLCVEAALRMGRCCCCCHPRDHLTQHNHQS